ncbi:MAG: ATP/GTP-binding protein, partial [Roseovarius sp.]|nr:ATP/GTP-binding protein [Roseovarius sp.]
MNEDALNELVAAVLAGKDRAVARAISEVENATTAGRTLLAALRLHAGRARSIGITGPPGAGKSTLIGALVAEYRRRNLKVGVVAIDPSSAGTGGAVLG